MLQKIASIMGIENVQNSGAAADHVNRVAAKIPAGVDSTHPTFAAAVAQALELVEQESKNVFSAVVSALTAEPQEKTLKIKSSPKGTRIKVAADNGVRFSFGPIWNQSVKNAKGIAVVAANRPKLDHQALMLGILNPENMSAQEVCRAIAGKL